MSTHPTSAFVVASGNLLRATTASDHAEAAAKAVIAHHFDTEDEPLAPGLIFRVLKEGDHVGDTRVFLTETILAAAGIEPRSIKTSDAPAPETEEILKAHSSKGGGSFLLQGSTSGT